MTDILTSPYFKFGVLPILSAILGIAVKYNSRNDQYSKFKKEDMAIGLNLALTACLMFVVLTTDRAAKLLSANKELTVLLNQQNINKTAVASLQTQAQMLSSQVALSGWLIALMFLGLGSISYIVRRWGWISETEMTTGVGITLPLIFGLLSILVVMASAI
jgi:hypothetical protein